MKNTDIYWTVRIKICIINNRYQKNRGISMGAAAENIMNGYSAFINGQKIDGNLEVNNYYTGTSEPSSELGKNGDIYLKK